MDKPIFMVVGLYVIVGILAWGLVLPAYNSFNQSLTAANKADVQFQKSKELKGRLSELSEEYQSKQKEADQILAALPEKEEIPSLLVQIEALSNQNGLVLKKVDFESEDSANNNSQSDLQVQMAESGLSVSGSSQAASSVKKTGVSLGLSGSYGSLVSFLKATEKSLRLIDVQSVEFKESSKNSSDESSAEQSFDFAVNLKVYYK